MLSVERLGGQRGIRGGGGPAVIWEICVFCSIMLGTYNYYWFTVL